MKAAVSCVYVMRYLTYQRQLPDEGIGRRKSQDAQHDKDVVYA